MEKYTWNDLAEDIKKMTEEQRNYQVCMSHNDDTYFLQARDLEFIEEDIYCDIEDSENSGTLADLKSMDGEDFDEANYKLVTPKGFPFLYDGN